MQALKSFILARLEADTNQTANHASAQLQLQGAKTAYTDVLTFLDEADIVEGQGQRNTNKSPSIVPSKASRSKRKASNKLGRTAPATVGESDAD